MEVNREKYRMESVQQRRFWQPGSGGGGGTAGRLGAWGDAAGTKVRARNEAMGKSETNDGKCQ